MGATIKVVLVRDGAPRRTNFCGTFHETLPGAEEKCMYRNGNGKTGAAPWPDDPERKGDLHRKKVKFLARRHCGEEKHSCFSRRAKKNQPNEYPGVFLNARNGLSSQSASAIVITQLTQHAKDTEGSRRKKKVRPVPLSPISQVLSSQEWHA